MLSEPASQPEMQTALPIMGVLACGDCDHLHRAPEKIDKAECIRCEGELADGGARSYELPFALALAAILLFLVICFEPLMTVHEQGATREDFLSSGALALGAQGFWPLTPAILFFSMLAPAGRLGCLGYVLLSLQMGFRGAYAPLAMKIAKALRPWAMLDVFLLGSFVAYTRLRDIVQVDIGPGGYSLIALVIVIMVLDDVLANQLVWRHLSVSAPQLSSDEATSREERSTCLVCGIVMKLPAVARSQAVTAFCSRCGTALSRRKKESVSRTWALIAAALIMYIPANLLPVMTVIRFGRVESDTILSGVKALIDADMWPLAGIVFLASIAVPVLKLSGLLLLLLSIHFKWQARLHDRTKLYRLIEAIGRWSNIDVFMVSILAALVQFGTLTTVRAGPGIIPFALVVLITMFASHSFDPRLMWDEAERSSVKAAAP